MSSSIEESSILADDPMLLNEPAEEESKSVEGISNAAMSIIDEDEEDETEPPLLQPVASRLISCMRAPCLKRTADTTSSPGSQTPSSGGTISPESTSPSMKHVALPTICSSFAAIKQMSSIRPKRQVHFDIAPPESGTTHSREKYDRRPIECTRAGSMLDLSLPSRGTCPNYSGEADDEACTEDEADDDESTRDNKERMRGFARWAKLKNGGTILGGATLKYTSRSTETTPSEQESEAANTCRVPAHGIRSFGGLAGSIGRLGEVHSMEDVISEPEVDQSREGKHLLETLSSEDQGESDSENAAFRQAVYAALSMSPNATPMPSPSVRTRWECVTSYFDQKAAALEHVEHGVQTPDVMEEDQRIDQEGDSKFEENRTPRANASILDDDSSSIPTSFSLTTTSSSPSMEVITNVSSSPMSSRCSSTDTWSSHGLAEREMGMNAFEDDILKGMTSFGVTPKSVAQPLREASNEQNEEARNDASSPCETTDSLETDHGTLSSTSMGCTSTQGWMSSCATSPEIGPSDGTRSPIRTSLNALDAAVEQIKGKEDGKDIGEKMSTAAKFNGNLCPMDAFSKFPAFLSVHQRRAISQSAPVSSSNSPCVLSADEGEENKPSSEHKSHLPLQRSSSHSRKSRKPKRTSSQQGSPADSDDAVANVGRANLSGDLISPPRPRRISTQRSKSMSAAQTATVKKSSFSACSFRSEIEDEGALGGF